MMTFKPNTVYKAKNWGGLMVEIIAIDGEVCYHIVKGKVVQDRVRDFKNFRQVRPITDKEKKFLNAFGK